MVEAEGYYKSGFGYTDNTCWLAQFIVGLLFSLDMLTKKDIFKMTQLNSLTNKCYLWKRKKIQTYYLAGM